VYNTKPCRHVKSACAVKPNTFYSEMEYNTRLCRHIRNRGPRNRRPTAGPESGTQRARFVRSQAIPR